MTLVALSLKTVETVIYLHLYLKYFLTLSVFQNVFSSYCKVTKINMKCKFAICFVFYGSYCE